MEKNEKKGLVTKITKGKPSSTLKKVTLAALVTSMLVLGGCGWNKKIIDVNYKFNKAVMNNIGGNVMIMDIKKWNDYDDGVQLEVITKDGLVILTNTIETKLFYDDGSQTSVEDFAKACFGQDKNIVYYEDINRSRNR